MIELIFATNNPHKVEEIQAAVGEFIKIIPLSQAGIHIDIPEPFETLEANASTKSQTIFRLTGKDCFSEDTGLEVDALGGEPGVKSARYAGDGKVFSDNIDKLLAKLGNNVMRKARFRTVISLIFKGNEYLFEGCCEGNIQYFPKGNHGFGYDPVFTPTHNDRTFAEMTLREKLQYSHRKKASDKLVLFLHQAHYSG